MNLFVLKPDGTLEPPFFDAKDARYLPAAQDELVSYDDAQCVALLHSLGEGWLLAHYSRAGKRACNADEAYQRAVFLTHPTHYLAFVRWSDSPNPDNNGYAMWGLARHLAKDRDDFERQAKEHFSTINWAAADVKPLPGNAGN